MDLVTVLLVTLHLLGVGLVVGVVFLSLVLSYQAVPQQPFFRLVRNYGSFGAALAILSGILLALRYKIPLVGNYLFDAKLLLIVADGLIAQFIFKPQLATNSPRNLKAWAWLSVLIVIAIVAISVIRAKTH